MPNTRQLALAVEPWDVDIPAASGPVFSFRGAPTVSGFELAFDGRIAPPALGMSLVELSLTLA